MTKRKPYTKPSLTDSWADEDYDHSSEGSDYYNQSIEATSPPRRVTRATSREPESQISARTPQRRTKRVNLTEPEFIMPSIGGSGEFSQSWTSSKPSTSGTDVRRSINKGTPAKSQKTTPRRQARIVEEGEEDERIHSAQSSPRKKRKQEQAPENPGLAIWNHLLSPALRYGLSTTFFVLKLLQPILGILITLWIIKTTLLSYLSPIAPAVAALKYIPSPCQIPILNLLPVCSSDIPASSLEFNQLMTVQSAFEDILDTSGEASTLPADMKRSEAAIRDLRHVVKYSDLPSRHELELEYNNFVDGARLASEDLTNFNWRMGRAVDAILSTNKWTLTTITTVRDREAARGSLQKLVIDPIVGAPPAAESILLEQYIKHTSTLESQINDLIADAQALRATLLHLDSRLENIAEIVTRDGIKITTNRDELLQQLWTKLGGNRASLKKTNSQLSLLSDAAKYRRAAFQRVERVIIQLQEIRAGLEDLRERVSAPETLGEAVPLEVHVENIRLGVERLQEKREIGMREQDREARRVLDRSREGDGPREIGAGQSKTVTVKAV